MEQNSGMDAFTLRVKSDSILERDVGELRMLLSTAIAQIDSFAVIFPDSPLEAIEIEPRELESPERGPVVVCPDAELYEMVVRATFETIGAQEYADRREEIKPLELPLHEYVAYLYAAIVAVSEFLAQESQ